MHVRASALGLSAVAFLPLAAADPVSADDLAAASAIDSVLVFPESAEVTRLGEIAIPEGDHRVIVSGLPQSVDVDSLRARFGDEAIIVGAVEAVASWPEGGGPEAPVALQERLQDLQDQMQEIDDRIAAAELQLQFLQARAGAVKEQAPDAVDPEDWADALRTIETAGLAAKGVILEARKARRPLEKEAERLQEQLDSWDDELGRRTDVRISLTATRAVRTTLQLEYQVGTAGWGALYEARLDSAAASLALERKIKVYQNSGEDWRGVRLAVSTAPPPEELTAPDAEVDSLYLAEPERRSSMGSGRASAPEPVASAAAEAYDAAEADERIVVTGSRIRPVDTVDANFASTYAVGGRVDVASDAVARTFSIGEEDLDVDLVVRAAPRESLDAFLTATLTYGGAGPLPGGDLRLYRDGAYLAQDELDTVIPGEKYELGFGVDDAVVVTYLDESAGARETGVLSQSKVVDTDRRFEAVNRHDGPYTVEIVDSRPIPYDDDISVRPGEGSTPPDETDFEDSRGVLAWRRTLGPGETLSVRNAYSVAYPAGRTLVTR